MVETTNWPPSAPIDNLFKRAAIMAQIRHFFSDRGVLEVETPAMSQFTITNPYLVPFKTHYKSPGAGAEINLWLMTSPEYHMKRLLAAGSGPIFQLSRSFRNEEAGQYHNPEFTMLEWYRPHYDMYRLINEVDDLLQLVLESEPASKLSYQQAFMRYLKIDPLSADKAELHAAAERLGAADLAVGGDHDDLLQLLFMLGVEPEIGKEKPVVIYHYPASQALLSEISTEDRRVAERFEVYYKGIELANGFRELTDAEEQRQRFIQDNHKRVAHGLPEHSIDEYFLTALEQGLPDCSGVALGVDRLIMLALNASQIGDVMAFTTDRS